VCKVMVGKASSRVQNTAGRRQSRETLLVTNQQMIHDVLHHLMATVQTRSVSARRTPATPSHCVDRSVPEDRGKHLAPRYHKGGETFFPLSQRPDSWHALTQGRSGVPRSCPSTIWVDPTSSFPKPSGSAAETDQPQQPNTNLPYPRYSK